MATFFLFFYPVRQVHKNLPYTVQNIARRLGKKIKKPTHCRWRCCSEELRLNALTRVVESKAGQQRKKSLLLILWRGGGNKTNKQANKQG